MDNFNLRKYLAEGKLLNEEFQKPQEDSDIESLKKRYGSTPEERLKDLEMIASKQNPKIHKIYTPEFNADEIELGDYVQFFKEDDPLLVFQATDKDLNIDYDAAEYSKYRRSHLKKMHRNRMDYLKGNKN